jgi:competence protein ComEA
MSDPPRSAPISVLALLVAAMAVVALARSRVRPPPVIRTVPVPSPTKAAAALREGGTIDLNAATAEELQLLPRIGPALSARIVAARPFASLEDLTRVRGIGARTLERLRARLSPIVPSEGASEGASRLREGGPPATKMPRREPP